MRKVKQDFFCIKTRKNYEVGDEYRGKRTDLDHVLEPVEKQRQAPEKKDDKQHPKTKKDAIETKAKKKKAKK